MAHPVAMLMVQLVRKMGASPRDVALKLLRCWPVGVRTWASHGEDRLSDPEG